MTQDKLITEIKTLITTSTGAKLKIGQLIHEHTKIIEKTDKSRITFYKEIGIHERTAQRYVKVSQHPKVKKLIKDKEIANKTMTFLYDYISPKKPANNTDNKKYKLQRDDFNPAECNKLTEFRLEYMDLLKSKRI